MEGSVYVAEDGLVRHQWEKRPLALRSSMPQCRGMRGQGVGGGGGGGGGSR